MPVANPEELVDIYGHTATSNSHDTHSYLNFADYRDQTETLSGVIAYTNFFANLSIRGRSELVIGEIVSEGYFRVSGIQPALGRAFLTDEFVGVGAAPVAILSHPFWQSRFAADPNVIGQSIRLNGIPYTVVGVAPEGFGGMFPAVSSQMWIPITMVEEVEPLGNQRGSGGGPGANRLERRGQHFLWMKGRMKAGVSVAQVRAEFETMAARLSVDYPETNEFERVWVMATNDVAINPDFDSTLAPVGLVLLGAVGLVLLVACANLANMMLSRSTARSRELALRVAIGAGPGRVVRQLMTESMMLALAGGAVAMALSYWLSGLISRFQPPLPIDIGLDITPDWRVMLFTFVIAAATGIAFGLIPAIRSSRPDLVPALKGTSEGDERQRWFTLRNTLVVVQVAVSVVVLVAGALLVRSLDVARRVDLGYDIDRIAYMVTAMEMNGYTDEQAGTFLETGKLRLEQLPEVEAVGLASRLPLSLNNNGFGVFIDGHQNSGADRPYVVDGASIDEGYFTALDLNVLRGRNIEPADRDERRRVAVVTETMANRYWPDEDALGREFRTSWEGTPYVIVGVVEDYKVNTPGESPKPYIHIPLPRQAGFAGFLVRTNTSAEGLVRSLEAELRRLDPDLVFMETGTLREMADVRLFPILAGAWLIGAFGVLALILATVGLYGVVSYSVNRRVREIGIRKALGAETGTIMGMVLRRGMALVLVGTLIGAALAAVSARALSAVLFVGAFDLVSFVSGCGVLAIIAALANWIPAQRASRIPPIVAMKAE